MKDYKIDLQNSDDKLLRSVGYFEKQGFEILSVQNLLPNFFLKKVFHQIENLYTRQKRYRKGVQHT